MCFKPCPLRVNSWQVSIFFGATSCVMQSLREGFQTHFCRGFYQRWILAGARSSLKKSECRGATSETRTCSTHHNYDQLCKQDATASSATAKSLAGCSFSSCPISSSPLRSLCRMAPCSGRTSMVINNPSWLKVGSPISARQKPIGSMTSTGHKQWQPRCGSSAASSSQFWSSKLQMPRASLGEASPAQCPNAVTKWSSKCGSSQLQCCLGEYSECPKLPKNRVCKQWLGHSESPPLCSMNLVFSTTANESYTCVPCACRFLTWPLDPWQTAPR